MARRVGVLILSIALMLVFAVPVSAHPEWCEDDPILHFSDGTSVHLVTSFSAAERTPSTSVTYDVVVPTGTSVRVTRPAAGQVRSHVNVTPGGLVGAASFVVTVSGGKSSTFDITVTQTGGGAGKQTHTGSSSGTRFSVTIGG